MADVNDITWHDLHVLGYSIVDSYYFGKNGILLIPRPEPPKDLESPMKDDTIFRLEIIVPEERQGEVIETVEELKAIS